MNFKLTQYVFHLSAGSDYNLYLPVKLCITNIFLYEKLINTFEPKGEL